MDGFERNAVEALTGCARRAATGIVRYPRRMPFAFGRGYDTLVHRERADWLGAVPNIVYCGSVGGWFGGEFDLKEAQRLAPTWSIEDGTERTPVWQDRTSVVSRKFDDIGAQASGGSILGCGPGERLSVPL